MSYIHVSRATVPCSPISMVFIVYYIPVIEASTVVFTFLALTNYSAICKVRRQTAILTRNCPMTNCQHKLCVRESEQVCTSMYMYRLT